MPVIMDRRRLSPKHPWVYRVGAPPPAEETKLTYGRRDQLARSQERQRQAEIDRAAEERAQAAIRRAMGLS